MLIKSNNPKQNIAIDSNKHPKISTLFLPQFVSMCENKGAKTNIETEYPEKMNPKVLIGNPLCLASAGKNGAMEL